MFFISFSILVSSSLRPSPKKPKRSVSKKLRPALVASVKRSIKLVKNDNVVIIDEFTGRAMEGRRFGEGQHQAIEAKENVTVQPENQTLASVTFQNYFRMYPKLSGMTGTALTEEGEFSEIYKLDVIDVPTNLKVARVDNNDEIYKTNEERDDAVIKLIVECQKNNQPVLVGTVSIEKSEVL